MLYLIKALQRVNSDQYKSLWTRSWTSERHYRSLEWYHARQSCYKVFLRATTAILSIWTYFILISTPIFLSIANCTSQSLWHGASASGPFGRRTTLIVPPTKVQPAFAVPQLSESISVAPWDLWHFFHPQSYLQLFLSLVQTGTTGAPASSFKSPGRMAVLSVLSRDMAMRQPRS